MITVSFPSGLAVTYNNGWFLVREPQAWLIYNKEPTKGGTLIASIQASAGALVEWEAPCKVEVLPWPHEARELNMLREQFLDVQEWLGMEFKTRRRRKK